MLNSTGLPSASTTNSSRTVAPLYWDPTAGETTVMGTGILSGVSRYCAI